MSIIKTINLSVQSKAKNQFKLNKLNFLIEATASTRFRFHDSVDVHAGLFNLTSWWENDFSRLSGLQHRSGWLSFETASKSNQTFDFNSRVVSFRSAQSLSASECRWKKREEREIALTHLPHVCEFTTGALLDSDIWRESWRMFSAFSWNLDEKLTCGKIDFSPILFSANAGAKLRRSHEH